MKTWNLPKTRADMPAQIYHLEIFLDTLTCERVCFLIYIFLLIAYKSPQSSWISNLFKIIMGSSLFSLMPSPDLLRCALWFLLSTCLHIICLFAFFFPSLFFFFLLSFFSFSFFLSLSLSRRLCLLLFVLHSVFFFDFLFIHPCIYLSVLFRPCVVCVCIRATSGIE